jgi:excisionase family DNA binding protein
MRTIGPERLGFSVPETAQTLGVSKTALWEAIYRGEVRVARLGRRVIVPKQELDRLLAGESPRRDNQPAA